MCVSVAPARLSATMLATWQAKHPTTGRDIIVLGYQNTAQNLASGPNAMILHFPAKTMSQENFISTTEDRFFLKDMVDTINPVPTLRGNLGSRGLRLGAKKVEVFEHDIYTVVLAKNASLIPGALAQVPVERRPALNQRLFDWYRHMFPKWPVALCCFSNRERANSAPLAIWYEPLDSKQLMLPGIDAHTGGVPVLNEPVRVDHWVMLGDSEPNPGFQPIRYRQPAKNQFLAQVLPRYIAGRQFTGEKTTNADFLVTPGVPEIRRGILEL